MNIERPGCPYEEIDKEFIWARRCRLCLRVILGVFLIILLF